MIGEQIMIYIFSIVCIGTLYAIAAAVAAAAAAAAAVVVYYVIA